MIKRGVTLLGNIEKASQYINYAHGQLAFLLNRVERRSTIRLRPADGVDILIMTHPHSIRITAVGGVFVTFANPDSEELGGLDLLESPYQHVLSRYLFDRYDKDRQLVNFYSGGMGQAYMHRHNSAQNNNFYLNLGGYVEAAGVKFQNYMEIDRLFQANPYWYNTSKAISWSGSTLFVGGKYGNVTLDEQRDEQIIGCCLVNNSIGAEVSGGGGDVLLTAILLTQKLSSYSVPVEGYRSYHNTLSIQTAVFDTLDDDGVYNINLYDQRDVLEIPTAHTEWPIDPKIQTPVLNATGFTENGKQIAIWYTEANSHPVNKVVVEIITFSSDYTTQDRTEVKSIEYPYFDAASGLYGEPPQINVKPEGNIFACMYAAASTVVEFDYESLGIGLHGKKTSNVVELQTFALWRFESLDDPDARYPLHVGLIDESDYGNKALDVAYTSQRGLFLQIHVGYYSIVNRTYFFVVHRITEIVGSMTENMQDYTVVFRQNDTDTTVYYKKWNTSYSPSMEYFVDTAGLRYSPSSFISDTLRFRGSSAEKRWGVSNNIVLSPAENGVNEYPIANFNLAATGATLIICGEFGSTNSTALTSYTIRAKLDIDPEKQDFFIEPGRIDKVVLGGPIDRMTKAITFATPYGAHSLTPPYVVPLVLVPIPYTVTKLYMPMSVTHI